VVSRRAERIGVITGSPSTKLFDPFDEFIEDGDRTPARKRMSFRNRVSMAAVKQRSGTGPNG
jgi:hypothetical protein